MAELPEQQEKAKKYPRWLDAGYIKSKDYLDSLNKIAEPTNSAIALFLKTNSSNLKLVNSNTYMLQVHLETISQILCLAS